MESDKELGSAIRSSADDLAIDSNKLVNAFKMLLTYPQCGGYELEEWIDFFKHGQEHMGGIIAENYGGCIVSIENHHTTEGTHYHALLILKKPLRIRIKALRNSLDFHSNVPNIQFCTNTKASLIRVAKYVMKDDHWKSDGIEVDKLLAGEKLPLVKQLETPIDTLVRNGQVQSGSAYRALLWAQAHWAGIHRQQDCDHMRGIWLYGAPGTGKTTTARSFKGFETDTYLKEQNKWFDGYMGEKCIVLDDLDTNTLNHFLKIWADRWACRGEIKGGMVWLRHEYFIVTSNYSIRELMQKDNYVDEALLAALKRRFIEIPVSAAFDLWEILNLDEYSDWHAKQSGAPEKEDQPEYLQIRETQGDLREKLLARHNMTEEDIAPPAKKTPPQEPDFDNPSDECLSRVYDSASGYNFQNHQPSTEPELPNLASEESTHDGLSELSSGTSIHASAKWSDEEESSEKTMSGGCEVGESYSDDGESEPEEGEDL